MMTTKDPQDIEKTFLSIFAKHVPPGLRERILESARKKQQDIVMTPRTWAFAAACIALIAIALLGDAAVTRTQNNDLRALLNGRSESRPTEEDFGPFAAEIYGGISGPEKAGLEGMSLIHPGTRSVLLHDVLEARERLKGWLDHEGEGTESLY